MRMSRYDNMTNDAWANKNEINDLKTVNGNKLTICVDNTSMSEENDENEIGFICKYLGNVKIGSRRWRCTLLISDFVVSVRRFSHLYLLHISLVAL